MACPSTLTAAAGWIHWWWTVIVHRAVSVGPALGGHAVSGPSTDAVACGPTESDAWRTSGRGACRLAAAAPDDGHCSGRAAAARCAW